MNPIESVSEWCEGAGFDRFFGAADSEGGEV